MTQGRFSGLPAGLAHCWPVAIQWPLEVIPQQTRKYFAKGSIYSNRWRESPQRGHWVLLYCSQICHCVLFCSLYLSGMINNLCYYVIFHFLCFISQYWFSKNSNMLKVSCLAMADLQKFWPVSFDSHCYQFTFTLEFTHSLLGTNCAPCCIEWIQSWKNWWASVVNIGRICPSVS